VHHVRELDSIPDEEDLQIVANQVPVAVLRIELYSETTRVTEGYIYIYIYTTHMMTHDKIRYDEIRILLAIA
jgi:hypothetical protein